MKNIKQKTCDGSTHSTQEWKKKVTISTGA